MTTATTTMNTHPIIADCLLRLAAVCDGASSEDAVGFNKPDSSRCRRIARALEAGYQLSHEQHWDVWNRLHKYVHTQLAGIEIPTKEELAAYLESYPDPGNNADRYRADHYQAEAGKPQKEKRIYEIQVSDDLDWIHVLSPYDTSVISAVKAIEGRRWSAPRSGCWNVPWHQYATVATVFDKFIFPANWDDLVSQWEQREKPAPEPDGTIQLINGMVAVGWQPRHERFADFKTEASKIRLKHGGKWDGDNTKKWLFPLAAGNDILAAYGTFVATDEVKAAIAEYQREREEDQLFAIAELENLIKAAGLDEPFIKDGQEFKLRKHQVDGVTEFFRQVGTTDLRGVIVADDMGLGKTIECLAIARAYQRTHNTRTLIICPAKMKDNWVAEAGMMKTQVEVFSWAKQPKPLDLQEYVLIADECFPYDAPVITDEGLLRIGDIVENHLPVRVLSVNLERNALEWKPIRRWISKKREGDLVRVKHQHGELVCTPSHKIWTEEYGYIEAGKIPVGTNLRMVRDRVFFQAEWAEKSGEAVLFDQMLKHMEEQQAGTERIVQGVGKESASLKCWQAQAGRFDPNETVQPNERFSGTAKNVSITQRHEVPTQNEGRQWQGNYRTPADSVRGTKPAYRVHCFNQGTAFYIPRTTKPLQDRYSRSIAEDRDRGRWEISLSTEAESSGHQESYGIGVSRVESVTVLQPSDIAGLRECASRVYNLEIADNHNYIADGILVSNCHFAQAGKKSSRGKAFLELALHHNCRAVIPATGTPMKNGRPINLKPLLIAIGHELVKNPVQYDKYFCNARPTAFTRWDTTGAAHLDELSQRLASGGMIRRTKKECLDLPPKERVFLPVSPEGDRLAAYREEVSRIMEEYQLARENFEPAAAIVMLTNLITAGAMAKIDEAVEWAEELLGQGNPCVIYSVRRQPLEEIYATLTERGYKVEFLHGESKDIKAMVDRFQSGQSQVFLYTQAGGQGITLTAAQYGYMLTRPWTPGDAEQAEDRLHRIGQTGSVTWYWGQLGTIDQKIDSIIAEKQGRIDKVMAGQRKTMRGVNKSVKDMAQQLVAEFMETEARDLIKGRK